jgi:hypothetical protein
MGPRLGARLELEGDATRPIRHFGMKNMNALHFEAHPRTSGWFL